MTEPLILTDADRLTIGNSRFLVFERAVRKLSARSRKGWLTRRKTPGAGDKRQSSGDI